MTRHFLGGIVLLPALAAHAAASELGFCSQPAISGQRIVFVSEGDLWTATITPTDDEPAPIIAFRLTSSDGIESDPHISPDGQTVAFSAQYDGNTDVYRMPIDGGAPTRLTFHPNPDITLGWTSDGRSVLFRSGRRHHFGRPELWRVSIHGGMPVRYEFGECSQVSLSATGRRFAFTRWSNERWNWKRYRGGTAPEIWIGDFSAASFTPLTSDPANDLFPMWLRGRVYFLSDRTGTANIFSDAPQGGDLRQHTSFAPDDEDPTAVAGYDVRWPSADAQRRGSTIVFCQAGALATLDVTTDQVRRLDVRLASDRVATRQRFASPGTMLTEFALSPDASTIVFGARGELISVPVKGGEPRQLTTTSGAREWGASFISDDQLVLISDLSGEQQIASMPADGSFQPSLMTEDRADWLFPPVASPDGKWVAFGDKTLRLHLLDVRMLVHRQIDASEAGEITDYRFSPDSNWLAYTKPMPGGSGAVHLYSLRTGRSFSVSSPLQDDREPRWDPAGRYLFFLSNRHFDPVLGAYDFDHVYTAPTRIVAVPLAADTPPPLPDVARAAGFDLEAWAKEDQKPAGAEDADEAAAPEDDEAAAPEPEPIAVDIDQIERRQWVLPIPPGNLSHLEARRGGLLYLGEPTRGLLEDDEPDTSLTHGRATLHRYDLVQEKDHVVTEGIAAYAMSADGSAVVTPGDNGFTLRTLDGGEPVEVPLENVQLRIDIRQEWAQIFHEAWRLQRDFYWAPNMVGVDWGRMKQKYEALLPRVGTRAELNDLIGQMIGELGTSHTYIWGGDEQDRIEPVSVGLLGAEIALEAGGFRLTRIIPGQAWSDTTGSPLDAAHLGVHEGSYLLAINGVELVLNSNIYDLLQDQAGKTVRLTIADDPAGANRRTIEVQAVASERTLRYEAWVESNRQDVAEASEGRLGYLHIPNMGGWGLRAFSRLFYPQIDKEGLVIDVRNNGGGFVSQMIIERLGRKIWAFAQPRHGTSWRFPARAPIGHMAVLIDQHAGSDGDIFPASARTLGLGPLIGTRTWGGVVGIRADKRFVDLGLSTQPEFAWWEAQRGWSIENEGVSPDIEVDITPADRLAGRDPQLDRAIEYLLQKLQAEPRSLPEAPPYPVRTSPGP